MIPDYNVIYEHVTAVHWCTPSILTGLIVSMVICLLGIILGIISIRKLLVPSILVLVLLFPTTTYVGVRYLFAQSDARQIAYMLRQDGVTLQEETDGRYSLNIVVIKEVAGERMEFPTKAYVSRQHWSRLVKFVRDNPQYKSLPALE